MGYDNPRRIDGVSLHEAVGVLVDGKRSGPAPQIRRSTGRRRAPAGHGAVGRGGADRYLIGTLRLVLPPDVSPRVLGFHAACPFGDARRSMVLFRPNPGGKTRTTHCAELETESEAIVLRTRNISARITAL